MKLLLLPGDGIGPEISDVVKKVLDALNHKLNLGLEQDQKEVGFAALKNSKQHFPLQFCKRQRKRMVLFLGQLTRLRIHPLTKAESMYRQPSENISTCLLT